MSRFWNVKVVSAPMSVGSRPPWIDQASSKAYLP